MSSPHCFVRVEQGSGSRLWYVGDVLGLGEARTAKTWKHSDAQRKHICSLQDRTKLLPPKRERERERGGGGGGGHRQKRNLKISIVLMLLCRGRERGRDYGWVCVCGGGGGGGGDTQTDR